ncbi:ISAs1 family transposase [Capnocytophaga canimorsus]|uniref:ISAs1 family transposase n=1 Tax=Capnocytophaga canimorsus TaxID=28188 RepID=UPI00156277D3|nr:ISAs1 family transposase [Capnocytophaga canimorsus]
MDSVSYFSDIEDFRMVNKCNHLLSDILLIGLFTYLSNGEDYEDMVLFAENHPDFVREYCKLPNGVPSYDTFNRVFSSLDTSVLNKCLMDCGKAILDTLGEKQICIDGKKIKGVNPRGRGNTGLYIVNAWVSENELCIGQKKVADKSNEITAIPEIINSLDIENAVVSIDAMGCQKEIASLIMAKKGHYLLSLKSNQSELFEDVVCGFKARSSDCFSEEWEYSSSRFETRKCRILQAKDVLLDENLSVWAGLKTLIQIESERHLGADIQKETRYYISSEEGLSADYFNELVRGHWGIENKLHWHLDVTFREDSCRARAGFSAENLSALRKLALQMIKNQKDKLSLKKRRLKAAYNIDYLKDIIQNFSCV